MDRRPTSILAALSISVLALTLIAPWVPGQDPDRIADQGDVDAQFTLGTIYSFSQIMYANGGRAGPESDPAEAAKWYRLAAGQGHAIAQNNLGLMHANGTDVPAGLRARLCLVEPCRRTGARTGQREQRQTPDAHDRSVVAWIGAEMEFARSQAVASGDALEHRPPECGHCVQNFLADLDLRDLPGEAARFELGADHALPTTDLRFYPAALVVPCGHLPGHAAVAADLGNMAIPNGWIPRRLRSDHCVLRRRYNHIQGLPIPLPQHIPYRRSIIGAVSQKARDRSIESIQEPG